MARGPFIAPRAFRRGAWGLGGPCADAPALQARGARAVERVIYGNRYPGRDPLTGEAVPEGKGISVKRPGSSRWAVYQAADPSKWPKDLTDFVAADPHAPRTGAAPAAPPRKHLHGDGSLEFPYEPAALPIIKSGPGARWNPDRKRWTLSVAPRDLPRTLEIARQLGATVDPKLLGAIAAAPGMSGASTGGAAALEAVLSAARRVTTREGFRPFPYQLTGVEFLARRSHLTDADRGACALLADAPGTGKTIQVLLALPVGARAVIVCPDAVKLNWQIEARRWRPDLTATVVAGPKAYLDRLPRPGEVLILNYDRLPGIALSKATQWQPAPAGAAGPKRAAGERLLAEIHAERTRLGTDARGYLRRLPVFLVADEAHKLKNGKAQRTQSFRALAEASLTNWLLTGTPLDNRPPDLWGTMSAGRCAAETFGWGNRGWTRFMELFNAGEDRYGVIQWGAPKPELADILRRTMLRRLKEHVLPDLPPKRHEWLVVEAQAGIVAALNKLQTAYDTRDLPPFEAMSQIREKLARDRIPVLLDLVEDYEEAEEPIVVASAHRAPLLELAKRPGWGVIIGGMPSTAKQEVIDAFQSGRLRGVGIAIEAAGVGITLTRASTMIFVDLSWTPGSNAQAEDRIHRIGTQAGAVLYRVMVSDHPLDQHVNQLLFDKSRTATAALDTVLSQSYVAPPPPAAPTALPDWQAAAQDVQRGRARGKLIDWLGKHGDGPEQAAARASGRGLPPLPPVMVGAMQQALAYLSSVCDYAKEKDYCGFNKPDAGTGHSLAMTGLADPVAQHVARGILRKYKDQLGGGEPGGLWFAIYGPADGAGGAARRPAGWWARLRGGARGGRRAGPQWSDFAGAFQGGRLLEPPEVYRAAQAMKIPKAAIDRVLRRIDARWAGRQWGAKGYNIAEIEAELAADKTARSAAGATRRKAATGLQHRPDLQAVIRSAEAEITLARSEISKTGTKWRQDVWRRKAKAARAQIAAAKAEAARWFAEQREWGYR